MEIIIKTPLGRYEIQSMEFGDVKTPSVVEFLKENQYFRQYKVDGRILTVRANSDADIELSRVIGQPATLRPADDKTLFDKVKEIKKERQYDNKKM